MSLQDTLETSSGLVVGIVVIGAIFTIYVGKVLPPSITGTLLLVAGGLAGGLFTRGTLMKGALVGAVMGFLVAFGLAVQVTGMMDPAGGTLPLVIYAGAFAFMAAIFFVPANTVAGVLGVAIRKWYLKEPYFTMEIRENRIGNERRGWIAMTAGAFVVAGSALLTGSFLLQMILLIATGFLVGFLSPGGFLNGAESGLITAILGTGILAVPMLWLSSQAMGFVAGLPGIVLVIVALIATPTLIIGGSIGASVNNRAVPFLIRNSD